jgi:hypothetical protein
VGCVPAKRGGLEVREREDQIGKLYQVADVRECRSCSMFIQARRTETEAEGGVLSFEPFLIVVDIDGRSARGLSDRFEGRPQRERSLQRLCDDR